MVEYYCASCVLWLFQTVCRLILVQTEGKGAFCVTVTCDAFSSGSYLNTAGLQRALRVNHSSKHNRSVRIKGRAVYGGG